MTRWCWILIGLAASACGRGGPEVVPYTSVDQVVSEPIFRDFERQTGVAVQAVFDTEETKSTGVVNRLLAEAQSPPADVFWSGDPVPPLILIGRGLVEPYASPNAAGTPPALHATDGAPVAVVYPDQDALGTLLLPTAVVLIKGGPHAESGRRLIDALLAPATERQMAESAAHMPLRPGLTAVTDVRGLDQMRAMQVDYASVASAMERIQPFLREWVGL